MESKYLGMTVNERLYVSGLMDQFDKAVSDKDDEQVKSILRRVDITDDENINAILKSFGLL